MLFFQQNKIIIKRKANPGYQNPPGKDGTCFNEKRAPHAALILKAGMTVEAALVLPLFIAGTVAMLFVLQVMQLQLHIQKALYNQTMKVAGYAYYLTAAELSYKAEQIIEAEYIKSAVIKEVGKEYLDNSYIENGSSGIYLNLTGNPEEGLIDVALQYKVRVPFDLLGVGGINLVSRARCHTWVGKNTNEASAEYRKVYVTANATVYHTQKDCTYLVSNIESCNISDINEKRNAGGGKYYACRRCCENEGAGLTTAYYTKYGERYHSSALCSNLHSSIYTMSEEDAQSKYPLCSKCEGREEGQ